MATRKNLLLRQLITGYVPVLLPYAAIVAVIDVYKRQTFYTQVTPEDAEEIVSEHIIGGRKIERLLYVDPKTEKAAAGPKWGCRWNRRSGPQYRQRAGWW